MPSRISAALYYLIHSTLATALIFLVADLVSRRRAHLRLDKPAPVAQPDLMGGLYFAAAIALAGLPPLSGFLGKLLLMDAWRDQALLIWPAILVSSFLMLVGLSRAGSLLFWKPGTEPAAPPTPHEPLALVATFALLAGLVAMTIFVGPVADWLTATADSLHAPQAYIAATRLGVTP